MATMMEEIYAAAAGAGFLRQCTWLPGTGLPPVVAMVGLRMPDEPLLNNLTLSTDYAIAYPATELVGLARGEAVEIDGVQYQVREVLAVGDGSEKHATLAKL